MRYNEKTHIKQCEKNDVYYRIKKEEIIPITIVEITHHSFGHYTYNDNLGDYHTGRDFGRSLFKTTEECKEELRRRHNIKEKRKLMKEYERKLNEELNLGDHYIVK